MQISEQTIIELVKGQATVARAVQDLGDRIDRAMPILVAKDKELEDKIDGVRSKVWYFSGIGTVVGYFVPHIGKYFNFGGK